MEDITESEAKQRLKLISAFEEKPTNLKPVPEEKDSKIGFLREKVAVRRVESVKNTEESRGKLDKKRTKEVVERLSGEAARRRLKLEQARRDKEEQALEEAYRLANTRHTNKESVKKLRDHEARTISKAYKQPELPIPSQSVEAKSFTPEEAKASGTRLMQRPQKPRNPTESKAGKLNKETAEKLVTRLYHPGKTLSASSSRVKFRVQNSEEKQEIRTSSVTRIRRPEQAKSPHFSTEQIPLSQSPDVKPTSVGRRQAIQLRSRAFIRARLSWESGLESQKSPIKAEEEVWDEEEREIGFVGIPLPISTPQPTTKDSNGTPGRRSNVDSPDVSSISQHGDDSFTRLSTEPKCAERPVSALNPRSQGKSELTKSSQIPAHLKLPINNVDPLFRFSQKTTERASGNVGKPAETSPKYSEEALFLMKNPIKSFLESIKSPTAGVQASAPMSAYRFVVGLNESDEFIYQDEKP